jgi:CheY-like chemotaxis protein
METTRIILADDQPELRLLLATRLRRLGYEVAEASNGEELLVLLRSFRADLIICDLEMPVVSGIQALARLRSLELTMPFILMTGRADKGTREAAQRLAAVVFEKPLDVRLLVQTARTLTRQAGRAERRESASAPSLLPSASG